HGHRLLILHNDGAEDFALAYTSADAPGAWTTLIEHQPGVRLLDVDAFSRHIVVSLRRDGLTGLRVMPLDGAAPYDIAFPDLLYGYGSYEHSLDPWFSIARLSLVDRGVVYAVAHVRGGGEMGRRWYEDGKMLAKKNTFTDFVACAQHLAKSGWTSSDRLVARGGSAGGLLMGAVANSAPEAFAGIAAQVPFVDALNSILDPSLPLTVTEWEEWGDPLHDPTV